MRFIPLRMAAVAMVLASATALTAQVNDKGTFHIGFALNTGVHATHFENSFELFGAHVSDSDDDGAVTVSFPLDVRYGLSKRFAIGIYLEPGTYLDSNATRSNGYFVGGISGRFYLIDKEHFAWDAGLDLGLGALKIKEDTGGRSITDTYAGGHARLCSTVYFYFGNTFGLNAGLKLAAYNLTWKDRDPDDPVLDAFDYEAKLRTVGVQFQFGAQVRF